MSPSNKMAKVGDFVKFIFMKSTYDMVAVYPLRETTEHQGIILSINDWDEVEILTTEGKKLWSDLKDLQKV